MLRFACGEMEICSTIKKSQNILDMIVELDSQVNLYKHSINHQSDANS